jgi:hypothetical protein
MCNRRVFHLRESVCFSVDLHAVRLGAGKSLAQPGRKQAKKNLMTARVSMLLKSRASPDTLPFSLCNKKSLAIQQMNRPLFPTTLSIPSYDIGKYVGLRTYQHPLVCIPCHMFYTHETSLLYMKAHVSSVHC